ncbi:hypothetical protein B0H21DRAFT_701332 [Amylocystis lapponica]|nr:hypothetical protein B0H21DRAFT_701332 [Amylocystis lapponica]
MSTIVFPWPQTDERSHGIEYTLTRVDDLTARNCLVIRNPVPIQEDGNTVFRATLHRDNNHVAYVVCKLTYGKRNLKRLRHEAAIYRDQLRDLQGKVVPRFYGLYEGEMENKELTDCLITQYCGEHAEVPFCGLSWDSKASVITALLKVHKAGVQHGHSHEGNIVFTPKGYPRIIDFSYAGAHTCEGTMQVVFHRQEPHPEDFACDELFKACDDLGVWTPHSYHISSLLCIAHYSLQVMLCTCIESGPLSMRKVQRSSHPSPRKPWIPMRRCIW